MISMGYVRILIVCMLLLDGFALSFPLNSAYMSPVVFRQDNGLAFQSKLNEPSSPVDP